MAWLKSQWMPGRRSNGDLTDDTGSRYVIIDEPGDRRVRVLTDGLGNIQAFVRKL